MRRSVGIILTTIALAVAMVTPVFATETTLDAERKMIMNHEEGINAAITDYLKTDNGCGEAAVADHTAHAVGTVSKQVQYYVTSEEANYIKYLYQVVVNKKETERIKKEIVDNYTNLSKVNPQFADLIPAAVNDYNAAVADRIAAENAIPDAMKDFAILNTAMNIARTTDVVIEK